MAVLVVMSTAGDEYRNNRPNIIIQVGTPRGAESEVAAESQTGTTLDDLMSTLKLLEEDEQLPPPPESRMQAWATEQSKHLALFAIR